MKIITGFIYKLMTESFISVVVAKIFRRRVPDGKGMIKIPYKTDSVIISSIFFRVYERPERIMVRKHLPEEIDCIELGSSLGVVSREILTKLKPLSRFVGIEASPRMFAVTGENITSIRRSGVFLENRAVAYGKSKVVFSDETGQLGGRVTGCALHSEKAVSITSLAELKQKYKISQYSLVMDIEGMEYEVLQNEKQVFDDCVCLIVELHGDCEKKNRFLKVLNENGFHLQDKKHNVFVLIRDC